MPKVDKAAEEEQKYRHSMAPIHPAGPLASALTIDRDPHYSPAEPAPGDGTGTDAGVYVPPLAGPHAVMVGTIVAPEEPAGPKAFYVGTVDDQGHKQFYQARTDPLGRLRFKLPELATIASVLVFRKFDRNGQPDAGGITQVTNEPVHVPNTQPMPHAPGPGPAVTEANTAYERGGAGAGLMQLQVRNVDPVATKVLMDGGAQGVDTLGASDRSVVAKLHDDVPLGPHLMSVQSGALASNAFSADVVRLRFDPFGALKPGEVQPVTLHVDGLPRDQVAKATFTVSFNATLESGGRTTTVPVENGSARIRIRAQQPGKLFISSTLTVDLPDFRAQISGPPVAYVGENIGPKLHVVVFNAGPAVDEPVDVDVYLTAHDSVVLRKRVTMAQLPSGSSTVELQNFVLRAALVSPDKYRPCAFVDPHNVHPESNKSNNEACTQIRVVTGPPQPAPPPDCDPGHDCIPQAQWQDWLRDMRFSIQGPASALPGDPATISLIVNNAGKQTKYYPPLDFRGCLISEIGFPALSAASKDPCYLSVTFAPEWPRIGATPSPTSQQSLKYSWSSSIPGGVRPGAYRLCVVNSYVLATPPQSFVLPPTPDPCFLMPGSVPTQPYRLMVEPFTSA